MKTPSLLVIALSACATFSCERDTRSAIVWHRHVEPRLTSTLEWGPCQKQPLRAYDVVEKTQCGDVDVIPSFGVCEEITETSTHQHVLNVLQFEPHCTDEAISALERFARVDPRAMSDVAAAYYVRAQRQDEPRDFLRALDAADEAIKKAPKLRTARFNRALILEALSLTGAAIAAWDEFLGLADPQWDEEARRHRRRLAKLIDGATLWRNALANPDLGTAQLIAPFPSAAQSYFEEELLPQWAENPKKVSLFATELSRRMGGDPFAIDVVKTLGRTSPDRALEGHRLYGEARLDELALNFEAAAASYRKATVLFRQAGSPFWLRSELGYAAAISYKPEGRPEALLLLPALHEEVVRRRYRNLAARVHRLHGYLVDQNSYLDSLDEYNAARAEYVHLRDFEGLVAVYSRRAGVHQISGLTETAWHDAYYAIRHGARLTEVKDLHALFLEAAAEAFALGHPRAAMLYHDANVAMLQREIVRALQTPENTDRFRRLTLYLGIALARRAPVHLYFDRYERASADLEEALRRVDTARNPDPDTRRILETQVHEVRGQSVVETNPQKAIDEFSLAFAKAPSSTPSLRVQLLTRRAEARLRIRDDEAAEKDLRLALDILRDEERSILARRKPGEGEQLWSPYFSRFQKTHHLLIRRLIEKNDLAGAFAHAERARAIEPLDLLRKFGPAPEPHIPEIQKSLPAGTFLIEYCVLDDRTYVWIVSAVRFEFIELPVRRTKTNQWSTDVQNAMRGRVDLDLLEAVLMAAYEQLAAPVLSRISEMPGGAEPRRLVFVPDGGIHGLPLAALRDREKNQFLIERAPIEIAGSAVLYQMSMQRDRSMAASKEPSILAVGDPEFNPYLTFARGMKRLKFAESEARTIHSQYAAKSEILLGKDATETAFFQRVGDHDIVHIAAHAIVNSKAPSRSLLLFAPSPGKDGAIEAKELLTALNLDRTRLVTLSACSSAGGLAVGPEGVAPLVRPLLAAGVPAVIGSLWPVNDATTEELMVSFYRHYETSSDAAVAMREAQVGLLDKTSKYAGLRSVLAWAPFQVIGHASSPFAARAPNGGTPSGIHPSNSFQRLDGLRPQ